jgi:hypothetical protein
MSNVTPLGEDFPLDGAAGPAGQDPGDNGVADGEPGRLLTHHLAVAFFGDEFVAILLAYGKHHDGGEIAWTAAGLQEAVDLAQWDFRHHYFHTEEVCP